MELHNTHMYYMYKRRRKNLKIYRTDAFIGIRINKRYRYGIRRQYHMCHTVKSPPLDSLVIEIPDSQGMQHPKGYPRWNQPSGRVPHGLFRNSDYPFNLKSCRAFSESAMHAYLSNN